jgi:hypothetical protein
MDVNVFVMSAGRLLRVLDEKEMSTNVILFPSYFRCGTCSIRHLVVAFDESHLDVLRQILSESKNKMAGDIYEHLDVANIHGDIWLGRFDCERCNKRHVGVALDDNCREYLKYLLIKNKTKQNCSEIDDIIKRLEEQPVDSDIGANTCDECVVEEMEEKKQDYHRYTLDQPGKIPNLGYLNHFLKETISTYREWLRQPDTEANGVGPSNADTKHALKIARQALILSRNGAKQLTLNEEQREWLYEALEVELEFLEEEEQDDEDDFPDELSQVEELLESLEN